MEAEIAGRAESAAAAARSTPAPERNLGAAAPHDASAWAAQVVALHEADDLTAAAHALRAFRAAYGDADTYLPDTLRDWAQTVK